MTGYQSKKAAAQAKTIDQVNWLDHEPDGLAQPAQEPVAYIRKDQLQKAMQSAMLCEITSEPRQDRVRIYTTPPQRTWVGLTDEEGQRIVNSCQTGTSREIFRAIEQALKEKNNG